MQFYQDQERQQEAIYAFLIPAILIPAHYNRRNHMTKITQKIKDAFSKGFFMGTGFAVAVLTTSLIAVVVTLPKTWTSGEVLTSTDLNANFAELKAKIESIQPASQVVSMPNIIMPSTTGYLGMQLTGSPNPSEPSIQSPFPRTVVIKNLRARVRNLVTIATTITVRINGANSPVSLSIPANAAIDTTYLSPSGSSQTFTPNDLFSIGVNVAAGTGAISLDFEIQ